MALDVLPSAEDFSRLIFSEESVVIAVGAPDIEFGSMVPDKFGGHLWQFRSTGWWLPVELPFKRAAGESINVADPDWTFWFENVRAFRVALLEPSATDD